MRLIISNEITREPCLYLFEDHVKSLNGEVYIPASWEKLPKWAKRAWFQNMVFDFRTSTPITLVWGKGTESTTFHPTEGVEVYYKSTESSYIYLKHVESNTIVRIKKCRQDGRIVDEIEEGYVLVNESVTDSLATQLFGRKNLPTGRSCSTTAIYLIIMALNDHFKKRYNDLSLSVIEKHAPYAEAEFPDAIPWKTYKTQFYRLDF